MRLILPFPPSVNGYWRAFKSRVIISKKGREFREQALIEIAKQISYAEREIEHHVEVSVVLYPPDKRNRDLDNYQKALFDSITHAKIWKDDSQIKKFSVEWGEVIKGGKAEITITPY